MMTHAASNSAERSEPTPVVRVGSGTLLGEVVLNFDVDKRKIVKCAHCGKPKCQHNAVSWACPLGRPGRAGQISFHGRNVFTPNIRNLTADENAKE